MTTHTEHKAEFIRINSAEIFDGLKRWDTAQKQQHFRFGTTAWVGTNHEQNWLALARPKKVPPPVFIRINKQQTKPRHSGVSYVQSLKTGDLL
jgi:hypothetical protein